MQGLSITLFVSASVLMALGIVVISLRLYAKIVMIKQLGVDDYFMMAALAFFITAEVMTLVSTQRTSGEPLLGLIEIITPALRNLYLGEVFYVLTVWALKLAIGAFLLRLAQSRPQRYIIYTVLLVISIYSIVYLCFVIFQCTPVDHFWHPFGPGKCVSGKFGVETSFVHAALVGTSDLVFATIPIFLVWNLQMNVAMKASVAGLLGLGAIGGITTFIRIPYIKALDKAAAEPVEFFCKPLSRKLAIWTCIEPGVRILVVSAATLRPLLRKILGGGGTVLFGPDLQSSNPSYKYRGSSKYLRSDQSQTSHQLDTFSSANKKAGLTTTVVEATTPTNNSGGKKWYDRFEIGESEVELNSRSDLERGIQKVAEFEAFSTMMMTPSPKDQGYGVAI